MASIGLESFCCQIHDINNTSVKTGKESVLGEQSMMAYNVICVICGALGFMGSVYQLVPRKPDNIPTSPRAFQVYIRQNLIICFLALADMLASLGRKKL